MTFQWFDPEVPVMESAHILIAYANHDVDLHFHEEPGQTVLESFTPMVRKSVIGWAFCPIKFPSHLL